MYERLALPHLRQIRHSVLVLGPRQVGKSTLLSSLEPTVKLNFANPQIYRSYIRHPEQLERELLATHTDQLIFLDEVQRVPALLDIVQMLLDEQPGRFRFLLSGSSARKLKRGQANLLPGRIVVFPLHPLLTTELGRDFRLDRVLAHGSLPGIYAETESAERNALLRSYVDTYLREEIQAEALVRDLGGYARLLDLVAAASGRILNLNALCGDAGISYETARRYLGLLEDTLVLFRVPAWSGSDKSSLLAHPKIFLFDLGVRNALLRRPLSVPLADERGLLFEHWIAYELYRRCGTIWPEMKLFHYRTRGGAEVDFVLQVGRELWAIEVKCSRHITGKALSGLASFAERTKLKRQIVLFLGDRRQKWDHVEAIPFERFVEELPT